MSKKMLSNFGKEHFIYNKETMSYNELTHVKVESRLYQSCFAQNQLHNNSKGIPFRYGYFFKAKEAITL